jgi:hypothetical protein
VSVPVVEVADEEGLLGIGRPLPVGDVSIGRKGEPELLVSPTELVQSSLCFIDCLDPILSFGKAVFQSVFVWFEPRV